MTTGIGSSQDSTTPFDSTLLSELKRLELRTRRSLDTDLMGRYRSAFRGAGLTVSDLREYQPGDDIRHIDWKVTARAKVPYVKTFEEDRQLSIVLAVDMSRSMLFGTPKTKLRRAREFAALLATLAHHNRDTLSLCLFADSVVDFIPSRSTRTQLQQVLYALLKERPLPQSTDLAAAIDHIRKHQRRSAVIFLLSDFLSVPFENELRALSSQHDVICVQIADQFDSELPAVGLVEFLDAESGERYTVNTSHRNASAALQTLEEGRRKDMEKQCQASHADYICVDQQLLAPLHQLMKQRTRKLR